jgi:hypothetical protein
MLVTVLYRLAGAPSLSAPAPGFDDVTEGQYYYEAVNWAAENKIAAGDGNNLFAPDSGITREQMAAILYRYAKYLGRGTAGADTAWPNFADADEISGWAAEGVNWCHRNGVISGKPDERFDPKGQAVRAEAAAMLHRFIIAVSGR